MHLLTTNKLTRNLNATRRQHLNVNLTAKYLRLKRLTLLTHNATTGLRCSVPQTTENFTDYRKLQQAWYTYATYSVILWVPLRTNCLST